MKAYLSFNLSDEDDIREYNLKNNASKMCETLGSIYTRARGILKYGEEDMNNASLAQFILNEISENELWAVIS